MHRQPMEPDMEQGWILLFKRYIQLRLSHLFPQAVNHACMDTCRQGLLREVYGFYFAFPFEKDTAKRRYSLLWQLLLGETGLESPREWQKGI